MWCCDSLSFSISSAAPEQVALLSQFFHQPFGADNSLPLSSHSLANYSHSLVGFDLMLSCEFVLFCYCMLAKQRWSQKLIEEAPSPSLQLT
eukprot:1160604-Pelagomonas_calceolata.AAC.6